MDRFGDALDAFLRFDLRADGWVAYAVFVISWMPSSGSI